MAAGWRRNGIQSGVLKRTVLVVDDEPAVVGLVDRWLSQAGFVTKSARSVAEALILLC